jgi:hypothetical protein
MSPSPEQQLQQHQQEAAAAMMTTSPDGGGSGNINREEIRQWMECLPLHEARMKEEEEAEAKRQH